MISLDASLACVNNIETVLQHLPAFDLSGCRVAHVQQARAAFNRSRVLQALWGSSTLIERRALLYILGEESHALIRAIWWCQRPYTQALTLVRRMISSFSQ